VDAVQAFLRGDSSRRGRTEGIVGGVAGACTPQGDGKPGRTGKYQAGEGDLVF